MLKKSFNVKAFHIVLYNMGLYETLDIVYPGAVKYLKNVTGDLHYISIHNPLPPCEW